MSCPYSSSSERDDKIRSIVENLEKYTQCTCDLDKQEPEIVVGHNFVCTIYKKACDILGNKE